MQVMTMALLMIIFPALAAFASDNNIAADDPIKPDETWSCSQYYDASGKELIRLTAYRELGIGGVSVAGSVQAAHYQVQGFNRRWDFGEAKEDGVLLFSFIIKPTGDGLYYDFSLESTTSPSQTYRCRQI